MIDETQQIVERNDGIISQELVLYLKPDPGVSRFLESSIHAHAFQRPWFQLGAAFIVRIRARYTTP